MKRILHLLPLLSLIIASCQKEEGEASPPPAKEIFLKEVVMQNLPSPYYHFEYDASGRATKIGFASGALLYDVVYEGNHIKEMKNTVVVNKDRVLYEYDGQAKVVVIMVAH